MRNEMLYGLIRKTAMGYFDKAFVESFISAIEKWGEVSRKWFFQVIQKNNKPTLEFSCVTDHVVVDATASIGSMIVTAGRLSAFQSAIIAETNNSTELRLLIDISMTYNYLAVTEESRKQLREYTAFLESAIFGG